MSQDEKRSEDQAIVGGAHGGLTIKEYFMAHAPACPGPIQFEGTDIDIFMKQAAELELKWRVAYGNAMAEEIDTHGKANRV